LEDSDAEIFTKAVNQGLTTQHLFTGSVPMRTADYAARWKTERAAGDILFAVELLGGLDSSGMRGRDGFVGTCGLHSHRDVYQSWECRFLVFDAEAVGKGLGKEIVSLLRDYAFQRLNCHRLWLGVSEDNLRAVKCYLDCGFVFEGRERDAIFYQGTYHSTLKMSILREEWKAIAQSS
jgi:RimJ/RimL family protein N-acetyltransferase